MNLIECLDQDLHQNSLDVILGIGSSVSSYSAENQQEYDFGSGSKNCETYAWIWQDDNSDLQLIQKCENIDVCEMKKARAEQQNRVNQFLTWSTNAITSYKLLSCSKINKKIRKQKNLIR